MHHEFHQIWCGVEFKSRLSSNAWDDSTLTTPQGFAIDEANGQGVKYGEKDGNFHRNIAATDWNSETKSSKSYFILMHYILEDKASEYSLQTSFRGGHFQQQGICWTYMGMQLVWVYLPQGVLLLPETRHALIMLRWRLWAHLYFVEVQQRHVDFICLF